MRAVSQIVACSDMSPVPTNQDSILLDRFLRRVSRRLEALPIRHSELLHVKF